MSIQSIRSCVPPSVDPLSLVALLRFGILRQTSSLAPPPFSVLRHIEFHDTKKSDCTKVRKISTSTFAPLHTILDEPAK